MAIVKRAFTIDEKIEEKLEKMGKQGYSRSFFCNSALKDRLKKLGLW
jgi:hypothetical protein